ncbi:UNVERIFIED_CONTAM: hypothetical protein HDU68_011541 [Siphonaria sp. JEL0065]|nr:hypothetical protein HDU68_011541 [Siphonaria sp. JEL0065]
MRPLDVAQLPLEREEVDESEGDAGDPMDVGDQYDVVDNEIEEGEEEGEDEAFDEIVFPKDNEGCSFEPGGIL